MITFQSLVSGRAVRQRGFTLLEVLSVVVVIGILTGLALPSFSERLRDRRTYQAAQQISLFYRGARTRALGRGAAQLVRYDTTSSGQFTLLEAVQNAGGAQIGTCGPLPVASCTAPSWVIGNADNRAVTAFNLAGSAFPNTATTFRDPVTAANVTSYDMCFTPSGRTFARITAGANWQALVAVPAVTVTRTDGATNALGLVRTVLLPPNGAARLAL